MAPPQLATDTPVLNIIHPLVVGVHPVLGDKLHIPRLNRVNCFSSYALAGCISFTNLIHRNKPLIGQHGFHNLTRSGAYGEHQFMRLNVNQQVLFFEIFENHFTRFKAV